MTRTHPRFQRGPIVSLSAAAAALGLAASALAIGPQYQIVTDATPGALNDVCALTTPGGGNGTGTVIGVSNPNANGTVNVSILTNLHVAVAGITLASFGQGTGPQPGNVLGTYALTIPLSGARQGFTLTDPNNPDPGPPVGALLAEDLAIVQATVKPAALAGAALAEWNLIAANPIKLAAFSVAPPASTPASTNPPNSAAAAVSFTQVGYGVGAVYDKATNKYIESAPALVRRFQNNTSNKVYGASVNNEGGFFEPMVDFTTKAPTNGGTGLGNPGDSGSPFLTTTAGPNQAVTPSFNDPANPNNPVINATVPINFTDTETAVFWGTQNSGTYLNVANGVEDYIPLTSTGDVTTGSLDWAKQFTGVNGPNNVPEPGALSLVALAGLAMLRRRRAR